MRRGGINCISDFVPFYANNQLAYDQSMNLFITSKLILNPFISKSFLDRYQFTKDIELMKTTTNKSLLDSI